MGGGKYGKQDHGTAEGPRSFFLVIPHAYDYSPLYPANTVEGDVQRHAPRARSKSLPTGYRKALLSDTTTYAISDSSEHPMRYSSSGTTAIL